MLEGQGWLLCSKKWHESMGAKICPEQGQRWGFYNKPRGRLEKKMIEEDAIADYQSGCISIEKLEQLSRKIGIGRAAKQQFSEEPSTVYAPYIPMATKGLVMTRRPSCHQRRSNG
jgi:hypothetical protein